MRLVVREVVEAAVDRHPDDQPEDGRAGDDDGPDRRGRPLEEVRGRDERERREVDEVPLDDEAGERRREVRALDRRVPAEADHRARRRRRRTRERPAGRARPAARRASRAARSPAARRSRSRRRRRPSCRTRPSAPSRAVVATDHSFDRWPRNATTAITAPMPSTTAPTQSQRDQDARQRRIAAVRQPSASEPEGERAEEGHELRADEHGEHARRRARARSASGPGRRPPAPSSHSASVAAGYAHGSSTRIGEYESAGAGDRRDGGEVGPAGREHAPREEERGEDRRGHHERLDAS